MDEQVTKCEVARRRRLNGNATVTINAEQGHRGGSTEEANEARANEASDDQ